MSTVTQVTTYTRFGGKSCIIPDPAQWPDACDLANSFTCPVGESHGTAYLLMNWSDLKLLDKNAAQKLELSAINQVVIPKLWIRKATKVAPSSLQNPGGLYLVEAVDGRFLLKQFSAVNKAYNVYKPCFLPASPGDSDKFYSDSLNSSSQWTWQTMLDDLWGKLPSALSPNTPTLPVTPDGKPENWRFFGVSAWTAINQVMEKLDWAVAYDPIAHKYSYVRRGVTQTGLSTAEDKYKYRLYDSETLQSVAAEIPEKITVVFARRCQYHTTAAQWATAPVHTEQVNSGVTGAITGTEVVLWDDLTAEYSDDGTTLTNSSALSTRASELAANWVQAKLARNVRVYSGCMASILPGSEVAEVTWACHSVQDGWATTVKKTPYFGRGIATLEQAIDWVNQPLNHQPYWGRLLIGELDGSLSAGGTATMSIFAGASGSEADTGQNVTVSGWIMKTATSVSSGKKVVAAEIGCTFYVIAAECE